MVKYSGNLLNQRDVATKRNFIRGYQVSFVPLPKGGGEGLNGVEKGWQYSGMRVGQGGAKQCWGGWPEKFLEPRSTQPVDLAS